MFHLYNVSINYCLSCLQCTFSMQAFTTSKFCNYIITLTIGNLRCCINARLCGCCRYVPRCFWDVFYWCLRGSAADLLMNESCCLSRDFIMCHLAETMGFPLYMLLFCALRAKSIWEFYYYLIYTYNLPKITIIPLVYIDTG